MSKSIDTYRGKRDFTKTPEPKPRKRRPRRRDPVFVVHRHDARRLHYDLRIEIDGVLKSWAVPKGFSYEPPNKRLAVRTEDHPLEYEHFDGVIPAGQYGAGTMTIWDHGRFECVGEHDGAEGVAAGKLELKLYGGRLRGEWHMVQLKKDPRSWLLFKGRDCYARERDEPIVGLALNSLQRSAMPQRVSLMCPGKRLKAFSDPDWLFELNLAGERVVLEKQGDDVRFRGTRRRNLASRVSEVVAAAGRIKAENALLDGVLVCLDDDNRPSAELLDRVLAGQQQRRVDYYAADLLYYDEWDVRSFPLVERKAALAAIVPRSGPLLFLDHERSRAEELIDAVAAMKLGGVIAKRTSSTYRGGESEDWCEIRVGGRSRRKSAKTAKSPRHQAVCKQVKFTNRDKVLWPRDGYTKGDLIDYYDAVADQLLLYLRDRPLSLNRFPDGIETESFFQKHTPSHAPDWIKTVTVDSQRRRGHRVKFTLCNDRATLLYVANLAAMELHPWSSRCGSLDTPDWTILDLDPATDNFGHVIKIAREVGKLLQTVGIRSYLKTSGSKGLHIYVPLLPRYSYDQGRMFCEAVAGIIVNRYPKIATVERVKERRTGKVYIDCLQNRRGQTIVAPYAVRPVHGACVSAPLDWDELNSDLRPSMFTIQTMPARIAKLGDLFSEALSDGQDLLPAIDTLRDEAQAR